MTGEVQATSWSPQLRAAGLRVTQPRVSVLRVLHADPHLSADQVTERVRAELGTVSTQAVYDTLNTLTGQGILRRIEPAGSSMRYEIHTRDNHHHLVCRHCGSVTDVPCAVGRIPCAVPDDTHGFSVDEAEVTYWGLCPECQPTRSSKGDDPLGPPPRAQLHTGARDRSSKGDDPLAAPPRAQRHTGARESVPTTEHERTS